jgi:hypothetical protein
MTNEKKEPRTIRELWFLLDGRLDTIEVKISNIKKVTFWIGGITGGVISGLILLAFKIFGKKIGG